MNKDTFWWPTVTFAYASQHLPSIIGLTETWLSSDPNPQVALQNYDFVFNSRQDRVGGGVALYIFNDYKYNKCQEITVMNNLIIRIVVYWNYCF